MCGHLSIFIKGNLVLETILSSRPGAGNSGVWKYKYTADPSSGTVSAFDQNATSMRFGQTVVMSKNGLTVAVSGPNYTNAYSSSANKGMIAIYEYANNTWNLKAEFLYDSAANDSFGNVMAINDNGDTIAAVRYINQRVCIIKRNASTGVWTITHTISIGYYLKSLVMSPDGNMFVAASNNPTSTVLVYKLEGAAWNNKQTLATIGSYGNGLSLSHDGTLLINHGSGVLYSSNLVNGVWSSFTRTSNDIPSITSGGYSVDVSIGLNKDLILISAPYDNVSGVTGAGAAHLYKNTNGTWALLQKFTEPSLRTNGQFATRGIISSDDKEIIISSMNSTNPEKTNFGQVGCVFFYKRIANGTYQQATIESPPVINVADDFGASMGLSSDNTRLIIGAPAKMNGSKNIGTAYIYHK